MYCERCNRLVYKQKCPGCGRKDLRMPQYDDFCYLTEPEPLWTQALKDLLQDNGVEYLTRNVFGREWSPRPASPSACASSSATGTI